MFRRLPSSNLWAAASALAVGLFGMAEALRYPMQMDRIIGPAVFPLVLSGLMALCAVAIVIEGLLRPASDTEEEPGPPRWRALACVTGGLGAFVLLLPAAGLVPAIVACVMIASWADPEATLLRTLAVAAGLSVVCTAVFVGFLNLPMRPFAW